MQYITRKGSFDSMHRVMNERMKCYNIHGHTYLYELTFSFENTEKIGYAVDFKEIKRIGCQWIDDHLDHGAILNPKDTDLLDLCAKLHSKKWILSLNGSEYCNPTVENISKEIYMAMAILFKNIPLVAIHSVRLYETPNIFTDCFRESIKEAEEKNFISIRGDQLHSYTEKKGVFNYSDDI